MLLSIVVTMFLQTRPAVVHKAIIHTVWSPEGWIVFSPGHGGLTVELIASRLPVVLVFKNCDQKKAVCDSLTAMIGKRIKDPNDERFFKQWALGSENTTAIATPATTPQAPAAPEAPAPAPSVTPPAPSPAAPAAKSSAAPNESESEAAGSSSSSNDDDDDLWLLGRNGVFVLQWQVYSSSCLTFILSPI